jgi:hypothetical protein
MPCLDHITFLATRMGNPSMHYASYFTLLIIIIIKAIKYATKKEFTNLPANEIEKLKKKEKLKNTALNGITMIAMIGSIVLLFFGCMDSSPSGSHIKAAAGVGGILLVINFIIDLLRGNAFITISALSGKISQDAFKEVKQVTTYLQFYIIAFIFNAI